MNPYPPNAVCNCNVGEICSLHDETKTTEKVKTMAKQTKKAVASAGGEFPYKLSDLDITATLGLIKSSKGQRVTISLKKKKGQSSRILWEGDATEAEIASLNTSSLMAFVKAKVGPVLPKEFTYVFKNAPLLLADYELSLRITPEDRYFQLQYFTTKAGKRAYTEVTCAGHWNDSDNVNPFLTKLIAEPSDENAQDFIRYVLESDSCDNLLASKGLMKRCIKAAKVYVATRPASNIHGVLQEDSEMTYLRYMVGSLVNLLESIGYEGVTLARTPFEAAVIPSFLMTGASVQDWVKQPLLLLALLEVVIEAYDRGCFRVELKKAQDLRTYLSKSEAKKLKVKVDDLIVLSSTKNENALLSFEDVLEVVHNGCF